MATPSKKKVQVVAKKVTNKGGVKKGTVVKRTTTSMQPTPGTAVKITPAHSVTGTPSKQPAKTTVKTQKTTTKGGVTKKVQTSRTTKQAPSAVRNPGQATKTTVKSGKKVFKQGGVTRVIKTNQRIVKAQPTPEIPATTETTPAPSVASMTESVVPSEIETDVDEQLPTPTANIKAPIVVSRPKPVEREVKSGFQKSIFRVLKKRSPGMKLQKNAVSAMDSLLRDRLDMLAEEAAKLVKYRKLRTVTADDIYSAARLHMTGELADQATIQGLNALRKSGTRISKMMGEVEARFTSRKG